MEKGPVNPAPWVNAAQNEFKHANQSIPWYLDTISSRKLMLKSAKFSNKRSRVEGRNVEETEMFTTDMKENPTYDAFQKDIGIINVFFGEEIIPKYVTANRMSVFDFLSQIGGSLGLVMGISITSMIELIYWFTFRFLENISKSRKNKSKKKKKRAN